MKNKLVFSSGDYRIMKKPFPDKRKELLLGNHKLLWLYFLFDNGLYYI